MGFGVRGSSYINLPKVISSERACINIENNDNFCFMWSILAGMYPIKKHSERTTSYPHPSSVFKYDDIEFPITMKYISKFENLNDLSVNILHWK